MDNTLENTDSSIVSADSTLDTTKEYTIIVPGSNSLDIQEKGEDTVGDYNNKELEDNLDNEFTISHESVERARRVIAVKNRSGNLRGLWERVDGKGKMVNFKTHDPLVHAKIEVLAAIGAQVKEICAYAKISKDTYYKIIELYPELNERVDNLKTIPTLKARRLLMQRIESGSVDDNTLIKFLERTDPTFAPNQTIATNILPISEVSKEDRDDLNSLLLDS